LITSWSMRREDHGRENFNMNHLRWLLYYVCIVCAVVVLNEAFEYNVLFCVDDYECMEKDPWRPFCLANECHEKYQMLMCMSDDDCKSSEICRSYYCRDILF
ncbi:hypothetical protein BSL78_20859, partial [Apostichopus japonicus]